MRQTINQAAAKARPYEVSVIDWPEATKVVWGTSAGNARYRRLLDLREVDPDIQITAIRSRVLHQEPVEPPGFRRMAEQRGIPFARVGMKVRVEGKEGVIVGHNDSLNLDVLFTETGVVGNCHPWWQIEYLDESGKVIKAYGDGAVVENGAV